MEPLGMYLQKIRIERGLTLRDVDHKTGLSFSYISMLEKGERTNPTPEALRKLADVYGLDYLDLAVRAGIITKDELAMIDNMKHKDEPARKFLSDFASEAAFEDVKKAIEIIKLIQDGKL